MDTIKIHIFNTLGVEYATSNSIEVPEGLLRWDDEFIDLVSENLPTKPKRNEVVVVSDDEDNICKYSMCFSSKKVRELIM